MACGDVDRLRRNKATPRYGELGERRAAGLVDAQSRRRPNLQCERSEVIRAISGRENKRLAHVAGWSRGFVPIVAGLDHDGATRTVEASAGTRHGGPLERQCAGTVWQKVGVVGSAEHRDAGGRIAPVEEQVQTVETGDEAGAGLTEDVERVAVARLQWYRDAGLGVGWTIDRRGCVRILC